MADPFTIAVSAAGLASLGIQLLQGLKQYAGSALDSKGRIKAISTDIDLTVQVVQTLETSIQDDANRAMMKDDAARLIQDTIAQCRDIFMKIQNTLPERSATGLRKRDVITWPFIEPKLDLLRGNLEKLKTSLQLLMNVIMLAAMSKKHTEQASLDQQRLRIEKLLEEKAAAEARLEVLERKHAQALSVEPLALLPSNHFQLSRVAQESGPVLGAALVEQSPGHLSSSRNPPTSVINSHTASTVTEAVVSDHLSIPNNVHSSRSHANLERELVTRSMESNKSTLGTDREGLLKGELESELLFTDLHDDYTACLHQTKILQTSLETALNQLFISITGRQL